MSDSFHQQSFGRPDQQAFGQGGFQSPVAGSGIPNPPGPQPFPSTGGGFQQPGQPYGTPGGPPQVQPYGMAGAFPGRPRFGQARVLVPGAQVQFAHSGPLVLGTMGSRFLARLVDGFLFTIPLALLVFVSLEMTNGEVWILFVVFAVQLVAMWIYESMMIASRGATVGKSVAGLRVVTEQSAGSPGAGVGNASGYTRSAMMLFPGAVPVLGQFVTFLMVLSPFFDEQAKQGWHDKAAKTYVISTKVMY